MEALTAVTSESFDAAYYRDTYRDYARQHPARKARYYGWIVRQFEPNGHRILDIGCAFGEFLGAFDPSWDRVGCDVSMYAIDQAHHCWPDVTWFHLGSALPTGRYDAITAWDVLEHVPDVDVLLVQIAARLDGTFILAVPVFDGPLGPAMRAWDRDETHVHRRSRQWWLDVVRGYFEIVDWWGIFRVLLPGGYYIHHPTHLFRSVSPVLCIAARRRS